MVQLPREMSLAVVSEEGPAGLLRRLSDPIWFQAFGGVLGLALVAELNYGQPASVRDPVSYAFAHGRKDGTPFAVDRPTYDATIRSLRRALAEARTGRSEKVAALKRLARLETMPVGRPDQMSGPTG